MKFHFGNWLRDQITLAELSISSFAAKVESDPSTVHGWINSQAPNIRRYVLPRIARVLKIPHVTLTFNLESAKRGDDISTLQRAWERGVLDAPAVVKAAKPREDAFDGRSVEPYSEEKMPGQILLFDLSVAAGSWADVSDVAEVQQPGEIDHGLFRIRIAGDSMQPKFKNRDVVEFRCLREWRDALQPGKSYYVQRDDGMATFKQLVKIEEDQLSFVALNRRKYKQTFLVPRAVIVRMAQAMGTFNPAD